MFKHLRSGVFTMATVGLVILVIIFFALTNVSKAQAVSVPTNGNVLCIYNSNTQLSKDICDYYLSKRPGAHSLDIDFPEDKFVDGSYEENGQTKKFREQSSFSDFITYVIRPLKDYVNNSGLGYQITHLAVAKDIPIKLRYGNTSNYSYISSQTLLSIDTDFNRDYSSWDNITALGPVNNEYIAANTHFDPSAYANDFYYQWRYRYAVSFLTGYDLNDIKKMIDKAVAPAPGANGAKWVLDTMPMTGSSYYTVVDQSWILGAQAPLLSAGVSASNIITDVTDNRPLNLAGRGSVIAYAGPGDHHVNYGGGWIAANPAVIIDSVSNRSILHSVESFNALTFTGGTNHPFNSIPTIWDLPNKYPLSTSQGVIADAFAPNAFGGSQYSKSFAGAYGFVHEPYNDSPSVINVFKAYASGLTLGESMLYARYNPSFGYNKNDKANHLYIGVEAIAVGDPLMRVTDSANSGLINGGSCGLDSQCMSGNCDADLSGTKICHANAGSCITSGSNFEEIQNGASRCVNDTKVQCFNGQWQQSVSCEAGCSNGECVTPFFQSPATFKFNFDNGGSIRYTQGFVQYVAMPVKLSQNNLNTLFNLQQSEYGKVTLYRNGQIVGSEHQVGGTWNPDLSIADGEGFALTINGPANYTISFSGTAFSSQVPVKLSGKRNFIGIPVCGNFCTASKVMQEIGALDSRCNLMVQKSPYNNIGTTLWWSNDSARSYSGTKQDFQIKPYIGYYVECADNTNITWPASAVSQPACTSANWTYSLSPSTCPSPGAQTKTWTKLGTCDSTTGVTHPATEIVSCAYQAPACVYAYSSWSQCSASGVQARTVTSSTPSGCQGSPVVSQSCAYQAPACTAGDWQSTLSPSVCPSPGAQTKTWIKLGTCDSTTGVTHPATEIVSCTYQAPTCTTFTYSAWTPATCPQSATQTRTIVTQSPANCQGGNPALSQSCTYIPTCTSSSWTYSDATCLSTGFATRTCAKTSNCQNGMTHPATETIACTYNSPQCNYTYSDWGVCQLSGTQTRTVVTVLPFGCQGAPTISQTCKYIPVCIESNWQSTLSPAVCPSPGAQTKTWTKIGTCDSISGVMHPSTEIISCAYQVATCTYVYSSWSQCSASGTQTRTVASSSPSGCQGNPVVSQACTPASTLSPGAKKIDTNKDNKVDVLDFNSLMVNWGQVATNNVADANSDGKVDILEFNTLMINWTY